MSDLNLDKFLKDKKERDKKKRKIYKDTYEYIKTSIQEAINRLENYIQYNVPVFNHLSPDYEALECIQYIVEKISEHLLLKKIIIDIKVLEPNILYIQWDLEKLS